VWEADLDEVEFIDAQLRPRRLLYIDNVMAVRGDNVIMRKIACNSRLARHKLCVLVGARTREDDSLDRHLQPPPLPCRVRELS
jgi:hypothetical protein